MLTEILGPSLADLQGAVCPCSTMAHSGGSTPSGGPGLASESQLCDHQLFLSSLLFLPSLPFPLSTSLMHTYARTHVRAYTHTHTHTHTHAFMCDPESMSSFYLWLAGWVGSFLLKLFVRLFQMTHEWLSPSPPGSPPCLAP